MPVPIYLYKPEIQVRDQVLVEIDEKVSGGVQVRLVEARHLRVFLSMDLPLGTYHLVEIINLNPIRVSYIPLPEDQRFDREVQYLRCRTLFILAERQCHTRDIPFDEFLRDFYYPVCRTYGTIEKGLQTYLSGGGNQAEFSPYGIWMTNVYKRYLQNWEFER